ncbi:MAG TPA: NAD-dependent deacylase [Bacteroidales bacterium]|nr:NAD-dependent deacylase [Bacteroidales bacterium]HSA42946.1 NAD-dependent deacylase [Bacteroidales bacterium]
MRKIVVLTGAGISAESGISTFRDSGGLWETHRIEDVATPQAWDKDPALVLEFYNQRRKKLLEVEPNPAHYALARLDDHFDLTVITQNVDDLHERGGSKKVLHLHGELKKSRSTADPDLVYEIQGWELNLGDTCEKGSQLRPHIVWFGEAVPNIMPAANLCSQADILLVIGTSLAVYPAAGLIDYVPHSSPKYLIDPNARPMPWIPNLTVIPEKAGSSVPGIVDMLLKET